MTFLRLESVNPAENRFRWYVLGVWLTLWGTWAVLCEWGRLDQRARGWRVVEAEDFDAARVAMERIVALRLRHGYSVK